MPIQIIDQYMTALKNLGIIKQLSGMVIGHFLCDEKKNGKELTNSMQLMPSFRIMTFQLFIAQLSVIFH